MIINSLIHVDKITSPISKEVKFKTVGNSYRGNYSQSYGKGLSNIDANQLCNSRKYILCCSF